MSVVGHELRTPLTSIRGSLGLLEAGLAGELPGEARDMVRIALDNTDRLVAARRGHARPRAPARRAAWSWRLAQRPARRAARRSAQVVEPVADAAGVQLSWEAPADLRAVRRPRPDRAGAREPLGNAVKFSPRGATVRTMVRRTGARRAPLRRRRGARHPARPARDDLRALPPGRRVRPPREGRHRARAGDLARDRRAARRAGSGPRASPARARRSASRSRCRRASRPSRSSTAARRGASSSPARCAGSAAA